MSFGTFFFFLCFILPFSFYMIVIVFLFLIFSILMFWKRSAAFISKEINEIKFDAMKISFLVTCLG